MIGRLTESWNSGSEALASHRLLRTKMFGFEIFVDTVWKNDFSYEIIGELEKGFNDYRRNLTASVIVDSALRTRTKTSAFKQ